MKDKNYFIRQISVFIDNKPATLAGMARRLAEKNINLRALSLAETRDFGTARIIVADPDQCVEVLKKNGYHFMENDVLAVEVADRPGGMADVLECIAREHVSVEYAYAMIEKREGKAVIILRVDNMERAIMALRNNNVRLLTGKDVAFI